MTEPITQKNLTNYFGWGVECGKHGVLPGVVSGEWDERDINSFMDGYNIGCGIRKPGTDTLSNKGNENV